MPFEKDWNLFFPWFIFPFPSLPFPWFALWPSVSCFLPPPTLLYLPSSWDFFPLNSFHPLTMLPCVCWLQHILILLFSLLWTRGENCPASCLCPDPHTVDCSGRGLTRLPDEIPLDVRRLLLADNWIPRIPSDFLVLYSDLVYLDLRNNTLSYIEPGTLSTTSRLVYLDLGSNNLTEIPKGTFGESRSLIKLRLGNNPYLSMVNEEAFMGLTSLRELELERNALSTLQVGALSQLPSLRVVRLEGNPWICNCNFANLFTWLMDNSHKLPNGKFSIIRCICFPCAWPKNVVSWQINYHSTSLFYLYFPCRTGNPFPFPLTNFILFLLHSYDLQCPMPQCKAVAVQVVMNRVVFYYYCQSMQSTWTCKLEMRKVILFKWLFFFYIFNVINFNWKKNTTLLLG